jgi:hypothetical protein
MVLDRVSFVLCLREAMFLSTVLTNIEVWYGVRKQEIEELESLDRDLLCQIFSLPKLSSACVRQCS